VCRLFVVLATRLPFGEPAGRLHDKWEIHIRSKHELRRISPLAAYRSAVLGMPKLSTRRGDREWRLKTIQAVRPEEGRVSRVSFFAFPHFRP